MRVMNPGSLDAAIKLLKEDDQLKLVSGGTDLIPRINQRLEKHESLCMIRPWPELTGIRKEGDRIFIGACTRLAGIGSEPLLKPYRALHHAASRVASPQIRNQATVGGNILQENRCMYFNNQVPWSDVNRCFKWGGSQCFQYPKSKVCMALFQSDLAPVLMAYKASVRVRGSEGEQELPVEQLYLAGGKKALDHDEILTGVLIPEAGVSHRCAYARWTIRGSFDFPLLSCAISTEVKGGCVSDCRIVFGSAGVKPRRFETGEASLDGRPFADLPQIAHALHDEAAKVIMDFRDTHVDGPARKEKASWLLETAVALLNEGDEG